MNYNITPEEFIIKISCIKPTGNVYIDTYAVKHFGEYIYSVINYQKWKSCSALENDVFQCITDLYPLSMTQLAEITQIMKDSREGSTDPCYTKTNIDKYIIQEYTKSYNFNRDGNITNENIDTARAYLEFSQKLYNDLSAVYKKYEESWQDIEDSYDCVNDKIEEVYPDLEDSYNRLDIEIENISNLVDNKIISRYEQIINVEELSKQISDVFIETMAELGTNQETKQLIMDIIVSEKINIHKLNYTMTCGISKILN
jgi:dGTP triphosphohydrolase